MSEKYYFTFPSKYPFLRHRFVVFYESAYEARQQIFTSIIKNRFTFQYSEKDWNESNQVERYGLSEIKLEDIRESYFYGYGDEE